MEADWKHLINGINYELFVRIVPKLVRMFELALTWSFSATLLGVTSQVPARTREPESMHRRRAERVQRHVPKTFGRFSYWCFVPTGRVDTQVHLSPGHGETCPKRGLNTVSTGIDIKLKFPRKWSQTCDFIPFIHRGNSGGCLISTGKEGITSVKLINESVKSFSNHQIPLYKSKHESH